MRASSTIGDPDRRAAAGDGDDDNDCKSSATVGWMDGSGCHRSIKGLPPPHTTQQEAARQRARLESPEGQRLLREFLAARADPKARAEQEAYLRQLEQNADAASAAVVGGGSIPEGKALVWPRAEGFVAKARRVRVSAQGGKMEEQKVFVNVVVSDRLPLPAMRELGRVWHCPNALGPPRVEEDSGTCYGLLIDGLSSAPLYITMWTGWWVRPSDKHIQ